MNVRSTGGWLAGAKPLPLWRLVDAQRVVPARVLVLLLALLVTALPVGAFETRARHAILIDADTGSVLFQKDADVPMPPASMSKMMTAFVAFDHLKNGKLSLDDTLTVSEYAWREGGAASGGSTMFLDLNSSVSVEDLLRGIVVQSGNDACIVLAEGLAGSEDAFAKEMNNLGESIGLSNSTFRNSTGLPDPEQVTTARDLARLAVATIEQFPEFYELYKEKEFTYNGIRQGNRNPLLYKDVGADGLKTGHTEASGYGLTASAVQDDRRLVLVVNGLESARARSDETERLMSWGFREFENVKLLSAWAPVEEAEVWLGAEDTVPLASPKDVIVTLPRAAREGMTAVVHFDGPIPAPIAAGQRLATLRVTAPDMEPLDIPLYAGADVERLGILGRMFATLKHLVAEQLQ